MGTLVIELQFCLAVSDDSLVDGSLIQTSTQEVSDEGREVTIVAFMLVLVWWT